MGSIWLIEGAVGFVWGWDEKRADFFRQNLLLFFVYWGDFFVYWGLFFGVAAGKQPGFKGGQTFF